MTSKNISYEDLVHGLYTGLFGRAPDPAGLLAHIDVVQTHGVAKVVQSLVSSPEFASIFGASHRIKVAVVGNCVAPAIAACLQQSNDVWIRWVADVNARGSQYYQNSLNSIHCGLDDYVITIPFTHTFAELSQQKLAPIYGHKLLTMTNTYFSGLHPDITYLGTFGRRIISPLVDYHSRIVVIAYLNKISVNECVKLFNGKTYEKFGYYDAYYESSKELLRRDEGLDIQFAQTFLNMTKEILTLHSVNHPTAAVISGLSGMISNRLGLEWSFTPDQFSNPLARGATWPVYPEIREAHRLPYETELLFQNNITFPKYTLAEFVAGSYEYYDECGHKNLEQAAIDAKLDLELLNF